MGYITQILQGLEYLHGRHIIHLDLKPENIIVSTTNSVKIIDFGSAQTYNPMVLRQLGRRVGTLEYMGESVLFLYLFVLYMQKDKGNKLLVEEA